MIKQSVFSFFLAFSTFGCLSENGLPKELIGGWEIAAIYEYTEAEAPVQEYSPEEMQQWSGKELVILPSEIRFPCSAIPSCARGVLTFRPGVQDSCQILSQDTIDRQWVSIADLYLSRDLLASIPISEWLLMVSFPACVEYNGLHDILFDFKQDIVVIRFSGFDLVAERIGEPPSQRE